MLRFIARMLGFWLVAAALVAAVVDGAKSIAASVLVTTPLEETWDAALAFLQVEASARASEAPWPLDLALALLFSAPTAVVLGVLGILLLMVGAKRRRARLGREFTA